VKPGKQARTPSRDCFETRCLLCLTSKLPRNDGGEKKTWKKTPQNTTKAKAVSLSPLGPSSPRGSPCLRRVGRAEAAEAGVPAAGRRPVPGGLAAPRSPTPGWSWTETRAAAEQRDSCRGGWAGGFASGLELLRFFERARWYPCLTTLQGWSPLCCSTPLKRCEGQRYSCCERRGNNGVAGLRPLDLTAATSSLCSRGQKTLLGCNVSLSPVLV